MTNKEDGDNTQDRNPRMAALLAVHLVSQVLDEAYDIANAARDSGQPWHYLSLLKSFKSRSDTKDECLTFEASKGDCDEHENKLDTVANVATSTPQKIPREIPPDIDERPINHNDSCFIGQGDEDLETQQNELGTSTLISRLFDMSEVESEVPPEQANSTTIVTSTTADNYLISKAMQQIFGVYMEQQNCDNNSQLNDIPNIITVKASEYEDNSKTEAPKHHDSDYSFLSDACGADINRDVAFYIDDDTPYLEKDITYMKTDAGERDEPNIKEVEQPVDSDPIQEMSLHETVQKNVALYEDAYATLNRDYDQGSEDGFPILQDPKGMVLQEVELMTANTSEDDIIVSYSEVGKTSERDPISKRDKELPPAEMLASPSGYKRNTLTRKFRTQGSRLLSCFRGMWRRGEDKSENHSYSGMYKGVLSPEVRHRTSSLGTKSNLRSPSPLPWKYKTINEVMLRSGKMKEYTRVDIMQSSNDKTSFLSDTDQNK